MTCAKRRVVCTIYPRAGLPVKGTNDCANPQPVCPREPGEGYEKCKTICRQGGHAEEMALKAAAEAGTLLFSASAYIEGHYYACEACCKKLAAEGVRRIVIEEPKL